MSIWTNGQARYVASNTEKGEKVLINMSKGKLNK